MPKVFHRKAGKDYPAQGIKKGDMYYTADVMTGPRSSKTIRSLKPIPRGQLTSSEFLSTAYDLSDQLETCDSLDQLAEIKQGFEELQSETQDKLDNMPEGLQQGPTGEQLQERIDQLDSLIQELDDAHTEAENETGSEEDHSDEDGEGEPLSEAEAVRAAIENNVSSTF